MTRSVEPLEMVHCPVYGTGETISVPVLRQVARLQSAHQDIAIVDTEAYGRCLALGGVIQTASTDHADYDAALLRDLSPATQSLLIIGGGDGCVAAAALERQPFLTVTVAEIDPAVAALCNQHFTRGIFDDPRVTLAITDVLSFSPKGRFDGIAIDLSDEPVEECGARSVTETYDTLIGRLPFWLNPKGWVAVQAGAESVKPGLLDLARVIETRVQDVFGHAERDAVFVASYGEKNAFVYWRR